MKIELESTEQLCMAEAGNGATMQARVWVGKTASGIPVQCLIVRVAPPASADQNEFRRELMEQHAPEPAVKAFDTRFVL